MFVALVILLSPLPSRAYYIGLSKHYLGSTTSIGTTPPGQQSIYMPDKKDIIEVKLVERPEALDLLQKKLGQPGDSHEGLELGDTLDIILLNIV